jgi:hypothetical protein
VRSNRAQRVSGDRVTEHPHYTRIWKLTHSNGWESWVAQKPDGQYDV